MDYELITFDCAQTLVEVDWRIDQLMTDCALAAGLEITAASAVAYKDLYYARYPQYCEVNLLRDPVAGKAFWDQMTTDWLAEQGYPSDWQPLLSAVGDDVLFGPDAKVFQLYPDVIPCLERLRSRGVRVAVVSNWDYSLHRVLQITGLAGRFELVLASLEEGVEKPDPRLFEICLRALGVSAGNAAHVGDNPVDDVEGALATGMKPVLIERHSPATPGSIQTLDSLEEALGWTA